MPPRGVHTKRWDLCRQAFLRIQASGLEPTKSGYITTYTSTIRFLMAKMAA